VMKSLDIWFCKLFVYRYLVCTVSF
jgi:hypothetical protein